MLVEHGGEIAPGGIIAEIADDRAVAVAGGEVGDAGDNFGKLGIDGGGQRVGQAGRDVLMAVADETYGDGGGLGFLTVGGIHDAIEDVVNGATLGNHFQDFGADLLAIFHLFAR